MSKITKIVNLICLIGYSGIVGFNILYLILDMYVHPLVPLTMAIGYVIHFAEKIVRTNIKEDEKLIKEIL